MWYYFLDGKMKFKTNTVGYIKLFLNNLKVTTN